MKELILELKEAFRLPLTDPIIVFSLILFIILITPIVLKKLKIPGIIGLIIAGIVIGPHGLYIIEGAGAGADTDAVNAVELFSTIGLLYIMFIAGLELDMNQFKANKNKSLVFGFYTFIIPLALGYPACHYLLGLDFNASLLTASMFSTHTLVTYPIISKLGISKNKAVAATVGGTILTDTAVLIILAVIVGNHHGGLSQSFWIQLGISLALFSIFMFLVIPRIARWFFRKLESEKHSHYIFVLSVVFLAAFLADVAGVEAIIGAFTAGLALNKLIPSSSALMNRIEFMGNSLFIPFFLISVGMLVDVRVIMHGYDAWVVAGILTAVAIFGKWLAAWITQLTFKFSGSQRQLIFGLSSAHAAATLAVIMVGHREGILDDSILNGTIILILIASIVASFATERAGVKIIKKMDNDSDEILEDNPESANEHILLPIDNIEKCEKLLELGVLIKDKNSVNPVSILTVVPNDNEAEANILKAKSKLENFVKEASASETRANVITTIDFNVASGIARISREIMADMIILGWPHQAGFFNKLIGSNTDSILEKTYKTTFICNFKKPLALNKRIVITVPPMAELEIGFELWVKKIVKLSSELSSVISIYCNKATENAIESFLTKEKIQASKNYKIFDNWDDFLILSREIDKDDLVVLISARRKANSFMGILENLPSKLEKYFPKNNLIVIYPEQFAQYSEGTYRDVSSEPLDVGLEVVQKLGKGIGSIFGLKKDNDDIEKEEEENSNRGKSKE
ncbi:MAG: cation:proton antiporter [Brumimicrobium sp.]|nr:cation:proton antiporter [Brumimicrobium sp.]